MAPQVIDIRQFKVPDFRPLLEAESRAWSAKLRWDYTATARLISKCLEDNRLSGYVLLNEGRIQGYSFFFCEGEKGLIGNLFVESRSGERGHVLLLESVIETLMRNSALNRIETQLPHFGFEELEPYFRAYCFEAYLRRFMSVSLADRPSSIRGSKEEQFSRPQNATQPPGDFRIEPWERRHDREAAQLIFNAYRNHVDTLINEQYGSVEGVANLIENIVHRQGCGEYLPEVSLIAVHLPTQSLAGVLEVTEVRRGTAHIPQIAVAKEFQGIGLGTAMMEWTFRELASRGYREVSLTVTDLNPGAVRLYERLGFETFRRFGAFVWNRP